ncbi:hypothetical protein DPMN_109992 [Dreissena polymorpha]|uniref:Uncharacterized protein n=1 Tax=Dreissena polymorpha TaxID=45954 RepID=A0A9D4KC96_DREPO|nr:hypothetical protein DPMN_109992 [Dreissena polymorpha]
MDDKEDEDTPQEVPNENLVEFKVKKSSCKAAFTRASNKMKDILSDDTSNKDLAKESLDKVEEAMDMAVQSVQDLALVVKDSTELASTLNEIGIFEKQYDELMSLYVEVFTVSSKSDHKVSSKSGHKVSSKSDQDH